MAIAPLPPFAKRLRQHRVAAQLTQEELAERAGLSARAISDLERGVKTRPHRATVELLADALHLAAEDRAALLAAVPPVPGSRGSATQSPLDWLALGLRGQSLDAQRVHSVAELRQILEDLVELYVEEDRPDKDRRDRQINITVIHLSVGNPVTAGEHTG